MGLGGLIPNPNERQSTLTLQVIIMFFYAVFQSF